MHSPNERYVEVAMPQPSSLPADAYLQQNTHTVISFLSLPLPSILPHTHTHTNTHHNSPNFQPHKQTAKPNYFNTDKINSTTPPPPHTGFRTRHPRYRHFRQHDNQKLHAIPHHTNFNIWSCQHRNLIVVLSPRRGPPDSKIYSSLISLTPPTHQTRLRCRTVCNLTSNYSPNPHQPWRGIMLRKYIHTTKTHTLVHSWRSRRWGNHS